MNHIYIHKSRILATLILLITGSLAYSFDFGAQINSFSKFQGNFSDSETEDNSGFSFSNSERLSLWFNAGLGSFGTLAIGANVEIFLPNFGFTGDLDYLVLRGFYPIGDARLSTRLGRFPVSDPTGRIFNHTADGGQVGIQIPLYGPNSAFLSITATAIYTGLLLNTGNRVTVSETDRVDSLNTEAPTNATEFFERTLSLSRGRLIGLADIRLTEIFEGHDLWLSSIMNIDLREEAPDALQVNTQHFTLGLRGNFSPFFYSGYFGLEFGSILPIAEGAVTAEGNPPEIFSWLGSVRLGLLFPSFLQSLLTAEFFISSGDEDYATHPSGNGIDSSGRPTDANLYIPLTLRAISLVLQPFIGNVGYGVLRYSFKPFSSTDALALQNLQIWTAGYFLFRPTIGATSINTVQVGSGGLPLGVEIDLGINWRPTSDLGFGLTGGLFIPVGDAFNEDSRFIRYILQGSATINI